MRYASIEITAQEVPGELSICLTVTGCPLRCKGCHSTYLWDDTNGEPLNDREYNSLLQKYRELATCVLFMGGEWHKAELKDKLIKARSLGYKTCLYTGLTQISSDLKKHLTWLKTGPWIQKYGGLDQPGSNQKFIEVKTNKNLNSLFHK